MANNSSSKLSFTSTYNPSLREEPRNKIAEVIPSKQEVSILAWLESTGRLIARDSSSFDYREDLEELQELMIGDDNAYEEDDEEDLTPDDDDEE